QDARYNSAADLLAEARKYPAKLAFGTAGVASSSHLAAAHLAATAQVKFTFVPYNGTGPAMTGLRGGQNDTMPDQTNVPLPPVPGARRTAQGAGPYFAIGDVAVSRRADPGRRRTAGLPGFHLVRHLCADRHAPAGHRRLARRLHESVGRPVLHRRPATERHRRA